jgi:hypothetical protein
MSMPRTGFEVLDHSMEGLSKGKVNAVLSDTPFARTYFIWHAVLSSLMDGNLVYYVDLDTAFTVFLENHVRSTFPLDDLVIFNPDCRDFHDVISQICSVRTDFPELVVLDSVTMFCHLFEAKGRFGEVNRMLGLYISLLQDFASKHDTTVLVSSLARAEKQKVSWSPSYPGGRVLKRRSDLILSLESSLASVEVRIVKHPNASNQGRIYHFAVSEN